MFRFEELEIWGLAVDYGKECYKISKQLPKHELFALGDQLRRSALSISNNIAEGSVGSAANFRKYIHTAIGSALETVNLLNFAFENKYITFDTKEEMYKGGRNINKENAQFFKVIGIAICH